ncbi:PilW family protein [Ralstonia sp. NFACC01]|uniref:PilW family protein n=1 Tax=Ralstonia sp. NFACC01 TaxID=1566294 RepID=UPI0008E1E823|nr:PilW family protein [Ralstonia sp. NFACC01]SFP42667.1 type IV pilus assembly protein PilW [Ralstonia sp. NFACC01]
MPRPLPRHTRGASLVELLVGMVIALMVLAIALQLMLIARAHYQRLADEALIEDRGMRALELIGKAVRQAGWITDTPTASAVRRWAEATSPLSLVGADDCGQPKKTVELECGPHGVQHSDALLVRFSGRNHLSPTPDESDGATLDCDNYGVRERGGTEADPRLGSMLLFISVSTDAEQAPRLMCRSLSRNSGDALVAVNASEVVRGVETLQLLYTLAPTSQAETVSARTMAATDWYRVEQVHVAIVVRGDWYSLRPSTPDNIALFPAFESVLGASPEDLSFQPEDPRRNRALFTATFAVRNPLRCEVDAC